MTEIEGLRISVDRIESFRGMIRQVAALRGVRVAKWLGDGAMIIGVEPSPLIATLVELAGRFQGLALDMRGGFAMGSTLLFDGDDYLGRPVNLASRLCDMAEPGTILASSSATGFLPEWIEAIGHRRIEVRGCGQNDVVELIPIDEIHFPELAWPEGLPAS